VKAIARAAGFSRQTVYAHVHARKALLMPLPGERLLRWRRPSRRRHRHSKAPSGELRGVLGTRPPPVYNWQWLLTPSSPLASRTPGWLTACGFLPQESAFACAGPSVLSGMGYSQLSR
jgi:hypothetical protein